MGKREVIDKYERFKAKSELEKDPLIRFCPKVGCEGYVKAKN